MADQTRRRWHASLFLLALVCGSCSQPQQQSPAAAPAAVQARNLILITIDTLRADRVGAYGYARARTPHIDALAARGVRFEQAFATAPITLPSHASLMTGRYPPGHGSRHNGIRVDASVPTLAKALSAAGFTSGAFVSAFPLDSRARGVRAGLWRRYLKRQAQGEGGKHVRPTVAPDSLFPMGNGEWGMGNGDRHHSPFPIPYSPSPIGPSALSRDPPWQLSSPESSRRRVQPRP